MEIKLALMAVIPVNSNAMMHVQIAIKEFVQHVINQVGLYSLLIPPVLRLAGIVQQLETNNVRTAIHLNLMDVINVNFNVKRSAQNVIMGLVSSVEKVGHF